MAIRTDRGTAIQGRRAHPHRQGQPAAERLRRTVQRLDARRAAEPRIDPVADRDAGPDRDLGRPLQHRTATLGLEDADTGGVRGLL